MKRVLGIGLLALLAAIVAVVLLAGRTPVAPWFAAVSNGNGYHALVKAAGQINGRILDEKGEAEVFVKANGRVYELVSAALKLPFEVPASNYSATNSLPTDMQSFKAIALALRARGREAEYRRANGEAVTNYLSMIELGQGVEHGPLIAMLVGIAIEKNGLDSLENVASGLSGPQQKELADKLEALDRARLSFAEVLQREKYLARQITGNPLMLVIARLQSRPAVAKTEQKRKNLSSDFRRVVRDLRSNGA